MAKLGCLLTSDITIGCEIIKAGDRVKNIGATFAKHMKLGTQVGVTCRVPGITCMALAK